MIAAELPQTSQSSSEPGPQHSRFLTADCREPDMAFIDDATHTGKPLYADSVRIPRQYYTLAVLATSVAIWAIMIFVAYHLL
jgi:hypothetical protein